MPDKPRTTTQNNSLHLWIRQCCVALNEQGINPKQAIQHLVELEWTEKMLKELIQQIIKAQYKKGGTSELNTKEIGQVELLVVRWLGASGAVLPPFPSVEAQMLESISS